MSPLEINDRRIEEARRVNELASLGTGALVDVRLDDGSTKRTTIKYMPWQLGHGQWVVGLVGFSGGYDVLRVTGVTGPAKGVSTRPQTPNEGGA